MNGDPTAEFHDQRALAARIPCPLARCAAPVGEPCRNLGTGKPIEGRPAHEARLWAAAAVPGPGAVYVGSDAYTDRDLDPNLHRRRPTDGYRSGSSW